MNSLRLFAMLSVAGAIAAGTSGCTRSVYVPANPSATPVAKPSATPVATPSATPVVTPTATPTPAAGTLYVADYGDDAIHVFPAAGNGNIAPSFSLSVANGIASPKGMTFDALGTLYVTNSTGSSSGDVVYFKAPVTSASTGQTITYANFYDPVDVAVDPSGSIYVLDLEGQGFESSNTGPVTPSIFVFSPGASGPSVPIRTISGSATSVNSLSSSLAVDATTIYVGTIDFAAVYEFPSNANGNVTPSTLEGSATGLGDSDAVRVDSAGQLVVRSEPCPTNSCVTEVSRFNAGATGNTPPTSSIETYSVANGGDNAIGECLDTQADVYLPHIGGNDPQQVGFFPVSDSGTVSPSATIAGPNTQLNGPDYCAVH